MDCWPGRTKGGSNDATATTCVAISILGCDSIKDINGSGEEGRDCARRAGVESAESRRARRGQRKMGFSFMSPGTSRMLHRLAGLALAHRQAAFAVQLVTFQKPACLLW